MVHLLLVEDDEAIRRSLARGLMEQGASVSTVGTAVEAGSPVGEVESTKSVSEIYSPLAGEVVAVNEALADTPEAPVVQAVHSGQVGAHRFYVAGVPSGTATCLRPLTRYRSAEAGAWR